MKVCRLEDSARTRLGVRCATRLHQSCHKPKAAVRSIPSGLQKLSKQTGGCKLVLWYARSTSIHGAIMLTLSGSHSDGVQRLMPLLVTSIQPPILFWCSVACIKAYVFYTPLTRENAKILYMAGL